MERDGNILTKVTDEEIRNGTFIIPDYITKIGNHLFEGCSKLISVIISEGVTEIGLKAFYGCEGLTNVAISNSVKTIGFSAFEGCSKLISIIIPEGIIEIGLDAFKYCTSLANLTIYNGVKKIGYGAFNNCSSLTKITIPESVTEIGAYAFSACTSLTKITIPESVTKIGAEIFYCCNLQEINIYSYKTFTLLDDNDSLIAAVSSIKNYYIGKIKYKEEDINKFKEYIIEHKEETYPYVIEDIILLHFVFEKMGDIYSFNDIDSLLKMAKDPEIIAILLEYSDKFRSQKSVIDIYDLDKYLNENLDDDNPFQKTKGSKN